MMQRDDSIDIHPDASANLRFVFGEQETRHCALRQDEERERLLKLLSTPNSPRELLVGLELVPLRELLAWLLGPFLRGTSLRRTLADFKNGLSAAGYSVIGDLAVFPNLNSARFCFPLSDGDSYRFAIREILVPRRYALSVPVRVLLRAFGAILRVLPKGAYVYQNVFLFVRKA